jgi:hypothetical protein
VSPDETHREVKRLEDERLRLASEVMGGNAEAIEKDRRLEERIREIARGGETHPDGATEPDVRDGTA